MRRILLRRPKFWRSENMAKFSENRHISYVINMSCKVYKYISFANLCRWLFCAFGNESGKNVVAEEENDKCWVKQEMQLNFFCVQPLNFLIYFIPYIILIMKTIFISMQPYRYSYYLHISVHNNLYSFIIIYTPSEWDLCMVKIDSHLPTRLPTKQASDQSALLLSLIWAQQETLHQDNWIVLTNESVLLLREYCSCFISFRK